MRRPPALPLKAFEVLGLEHGWSRKEILLHFLAQWHTEAEKEMAAEALADEYREALREEWEEELREKLRP